MKLLIPFIIASTIYFGSAQADIAIDKQVVDVACSQEARMAHCGLEMVGTGLLRCLQANKYFPLSAGCQAAIRRFENDTTPAFAGPIEVVRPTYPSPAPGYIWRFHPQYGWGWYHPRFGWHLGWR